MPLLFNFSNIQIEIGPIPWFIIPENFNEDVRLEATVIVVAFYWLFTFVTILIWPYMSVGMGMFALLLFFMFMTVAALIFGGLFIHDKVKQKIQDDADSDKPTVMKKINTEL